MNIKSQIEAVLFYKNEPTSVKNLGKILEVDENLIKKGVGELYQDLKERGINLIINGEEVALTTSKEASGIIEKIVKEEMDREIGKAGLETLSIILYKGKVTRREIDYIRGVNSSYILRNLAIRGLVERDNSENDQRSIKYKPSINLLAHLGITRIEDLPDFQKSKENMDVIMKKYGGTV